MSKYRNAAVFVIWALLLYRVGTTVTDDGYYSTASLVELALLAWIGGLAANELIRYVIYRYRRVNGP